MQPYQWWTNNAIFELNNDTVNRYAWCIFDCVVNSISKVVENKIINTIFYSENQLWNQIEYIHVLWCPGSDQNQVMMVYDKGHQVSRVIIFKIKCITNV